MQPIAWIADDALETIRQEADRMHPLETGGVLLGWRNHGQHVVTAATGPGPNAQHSRFRFRPDGDYRNAEIIRHFDRSNGAVIYLGDWHTHPDQSTPLMSWLDRRELGRIARHPASGTEQPLMMILGGQAPRVVRGWIASGMTREWLITMAVTQDIDIKRFSPPASEP